jgi:uncharacterized protein YjgD (DUF1641 family)
VAVPIDFTPKPADPKLELMRRLSSAPIDHAESLLAGLELLEEAHRQGVLDLVRGGLGAKDTIVGLLAQYSADPASVNALRNLLAIGKLMGALDPEPLSTLSKEMAESAESPRAETPPSVWELFKRIQQPEARRGLSFLISLLAALGRAAK